MDRHYVFIVTFMLILHLVQAQDQTGFINVDCGLPPHESPYNAFSTGLTYTSDTSLVNSGETSRIAKEFEQNYTKPIMTLRYFPNGERNCYSLNVTRDTKYLIKARFVYGNYDDLKIDPGFDLYLGPNMWTTVSGNDTRVEIIHVAKSDSLQVCLVKTGESIPFINVLELRPLPKTSYDTERGSLKYLIRWYLSNSDPDRTIRYPDDIYDREWYPYFLENSWAQVTSVLGVDVTSSDELPEDVMATGATPLNDKEQLSITWNVGLPPTAKVYPYMYFGELQNLRDNDTREFTVSLNGHDVVGPYSPVQGKTNLVAIREPVECDGGECLMKIVKTSTSTLPPLLNAIEAFSVIDFPQMETYEEDVAAIKNIQDTYGLSRNSWQGDPCVPKQFLWDGLKCNSSDISRPPIITELDLSSSGLTGNITQAFQRLIHLKILVLENNNLTGEIPEFLADMKSLNAVVLTGNNLTGSVPPSLLLLQKKGLMLHFDNNPHLCTTGSCVHEGEDGHKKKNIIVPVVAASIALIFVLICAFVIMFLVLRKKKRASKAEGPRPSSMQESDGRLSQPKNRRFTYSEVMTMTNNFQRIVGKGGFGIVYHGFVNGTEQVAVKILSHSSSQGYKQFKAEVELLLRVHHKNLVGLVGYCDEGDNLALIYEYMANGDLKEHLSGRRNRFVLNWGTRLKIVIESAQGLEYLHNGCKPPMIHRDVKPTNILLNEHFEAKIADFGLSRSFPMEGETHVSTVVAGTPGYLDPEYYRTNWLTEKSDVYSFGVVLLEMITNRPVIDQSREKPHIGEWVGLMLTKGDIISIMDPSINGDYDSGSVWKAVELAMSCLNPSSMRRPTMSQVVIGLNECLASENSRGGASRDMDSTSSIDVSLTFGTDVIPTSR